MEHPGQSHILDDYHRTFDFGNRRSALLPTTVSDFIDLIRIAGNLPAMNYRTAAESFRTGPSPVLDAVLRIQNSRYESLVPYGPLDGPGRLKWCDKAAEVYSFLCFASGVFEWIADLKRLSNERQTKIRKDTKKTRVHMSSEIDLEAVGNKHLVYNMELPEVWLIKIVKGRISGSKYTNPTVALKDAFITVVFSGDWDPGRVRRCAYSKCGRIFWARRIDQLCCSPNCNNSRWQQIHYWRDPGESKSRIYLAAQDRLDKRSREK